MEARVRQCESFTHRPNSHGIMIFCLLDRNNMPKGCASDLLETKQAA